MWKGGKTIQFSQKMWRWGQFWKLVFVMPFYSGFHSRSRMKKILWDPRLFSSLFAASPNFTHVTKQGEMLFIYDFHSPKCIPPYFQSKPNKALVVHNCLNLVFLASNNILMGCCWFYFLYIWRLQRDLGLVIPSLSHHLWGIVNKYKGSLYG